MFANWQFRACTNYCLCFLAAAVFFCVCARVGVATGVVLNSSSVLLDNEAQTTENRYVSRDLKCVLHVLKQPSRLASASLGCGDDETGRKQLKSKVDQNLNPVVVN
jgi:hypothetical protein